MIIRQILLKNFQAHSKLAIDLSDFNIVVGPSSAGKTAILRALDWLLYGNWDSTYPNIVGEETAVAIKLEDGTMVGRFRKGKKNWAIVKQSDGKPLKYEDFGEIIPGIFDLIRVAPIKIGSRKINLNFSMQDDPIFMLTETAPTRAQWLGRLYGAHIVSHMLRLMSTDKRRVDADKRSADAEVESLRNRVAEYSDLNTKEALLSDAKSSLERLKSLEECSSLLSDIYREHEILSTKSNLLEVDLDELRLSIERLIELQNVASALDNISRSEAILSEKDKLLSLDLEDIRTKINRLVELESVRELMVKASELEEASKINPALEKLNTDELLADITRLRGISDIFNELTQVDGDLSVCSKRIANAEEECDKARKAVMDGVFADGKCPVCNSKIKETKAIETADRFANLIKS